MSTELATIEQKNALQVFTADKGLDPLIQQIRAQVEAEVLDPSTEEGRKAIGSMAKKIGGAKVQLKKMGQALTEDWRTKTKAVTSETTRMENELDALRDKVLAPRAEYEAKIAARKQEFDERIMAIGEQANFEGFTEPTVEELEDAIITVNKMFDVADDNTPMEWEEFFARASQTTLTTVQRLTDMLAKRKKYEAEQAELKRLQNEETERKAQAERDRIAKEAADKATKDAEEKAAKAAAEAKKIADDAALAAAAETKRIADEKAAVEKKAAQDKINADIRAESDRQAADERERKAKIQYDKDMADAIVAEQKRIADLQVSADAETARLKKIDNDRAADIKHRANINLGIRDDLRVAVPYELSEKDAELIVIALSTGKIKNVKITY